MSDGGGWNHARDSTFQSRSDDSQPQIPARAVSLYAASGLKMSSASAMSRESLSPLFQISRSWLVDLSAGQPGGQVHLIRNPALEVVRVLVALAVTHRLHQARWCVAQVQRHRLVAGLLDQLASSAIGRERRVGLGR